MLAKAIGMTVVLTDVVADNGAAFFPTLQDLTETQFAVLEALYHLGVVYELRGALETAISAYDLLLTQDPPEELAPSVHFRRGLCLEELGRFDEALKAFAKVPTTGGLSLNDRVTYDVARGVAMLGSGKEAKGVELLQAALSTARRDPELAWILGKGWYTLARHDLDQAAALSLNESERKVKKNLEARAGLIMDAEADLVHVVEQLAFGDRPEHQQHALDVGVLELVVRCVLDHHPRAVGTPHAHVVDGVRAEVGGCETVRSGELVGADLRSYQLIPNFSIRSELLDRVSK